MLRGLSQEGLDCVKTATASTAGAPGKIFTNAAMYNTSLSVLMNSCDGCAHIQNMRRLFVFVTSGEGGGDMRQPLEHCSRFHADPRTAQ